MTRYRSILTFVLVILATVLVSCGGTPAAKGPVYSTAQLEQIQRYSADIQTLRDRMDELAPLIETEQWNDVESFIHGPLGELRVRMARLARSLEPKVQKTAQDSAQEVFDHLIAIDEAAQTRDFAKATSNYREALRDFESFFQLIPG
ncbi:MAG: photosystem II protein PsbQ [Pegethrix bostrychoides GSE-TBD4-15B]|jgi:photosystem II protein PsbQ|uniref:Photosystem II protein PsbQ n=1 Tax=Pegethrix bostrychoides GSE-TBD4-15B TaxID=2839662 RepID=A0A951PES6_9CYAN|nr:photosystem II protein PsbQ [Pegethrix bostrychoides GSE-TBD4-15B]